MSANETTAMVPASVDASKYFSPDQVGLIKSQIAKGCTDDELKLFLYQAARTGLDPLSRQIYAIRRKQWDSDANAKVDKMSIQTGIDGFRLVADRTNRYAPGKDNVYEYDDEKRLVKATATVMKLVGGTWHPVEASAFFWEYAQVNAKGELTAMWKDKPHIMLGKCAEALALRKAFPAELSGIYTSDEMAQADNPAPAYIPPAKAEEPPATDLPKSEPSSGKHSSRGSRTKDQTSTPTPAPATETPSGASSSEPGTPGDMGKAVRIWELLTKPQPDGLGYARPKAMNWLKARTGFAASNAVPFKMQDTVISLLETRKDQGEQAYDEALDVAAAAGLITGRNGEKAA